MIRCLKIKFGCLGVLGEIKFSCCEKFATKFCEIAMRI